MSFSLRKDPDGAVVVGVDGQLIVGNRQELKQLVLDALEDGARRFVIDFTLTGYIDSSGLGVLVSLSKKLREQGGWQVLLSGAHRALKPCPRAFADEVALELGDAGEHRQDQARDGIAAGADVEPLRGRDEADAGGAQRRDVAMEIERRAREAIELPHQHRADLPTVREVHHALEPRPIVGRARARLFDLERHPVAARLGRLAELARHQRRVLVRRRHPVVERARRAVVRGAR